MILRQIREEKERRRRQAERDRIEQDAEAIRERCRTFAGFVKEAWPVLEPNARYVHNWHIDAIGDHLEAVSYGQINRLLINVPPGTSKSLLVSVLFNAWEWGPRGLRSYRYLTTSYNDIPVKRDSRKCRDLIRSDWYQSLWPEVKLVRAGELSFANSDTGSREGVPFGSLTSQRGDRLINDDPHSIKTAESDAERNTTTRLFREGALNRLNDQQRSAIIVIMQRLHEQDTSGVILKHLEDYVHLMLPMEYEPERHCTTCIGFSDPRTQDGELLDPVRFPREEVERLKRGMGSYAYAGQYQQRPSPREGAMFSRSDFGIVKAAPAGTVWVRAWDLAATKDNPTAARTAGVKIGRTPGDRYIVGGCNAKRRSPAEARRAVLNTAQQDGYDVSISLPQDPGQAGKDQAQQYVAMLAGFVAKTSPESGDKVTRAEPFAAQVEAGNVDLLEGDWNDEFLTEICAFPTAALKDIVDAASRAFNELAGKAGSLLDHVDD